MTLESACFEAEEVKVRSESVLKLDVPACVPLKSSVSVPAFAQREKIAWIL